MWKRRTTRERELSAELKSHLDMHVADNVRAGMTRDEARRQALLALGGVEPTKERYRAAFGLTWVDALMKDIQFGIRAMRRNPGFAALAIVTLAVGIAATNTAFTIMNAVLLRPLPFDEPDRLVDVGMVVREGGDTNLSYADFKDWQRATRTFEGLAAFQSGNMNVSDDDIAAERFLGYWISANTFRLLRVRPAFGRDFSGSDDQPGAPPVVVLSDRIWKRRYGGDPEILGRSIRVNTRPATVIGVMPADMEFPMNTASWQPLAQIPGLAERPRDARNLAVFGRLADGVTADDANGELNAIAANLAREFPQSNAGTRARVGRFRPGIGAPLFIVFGALMSAVGLLLLVSCANVTNLLLARALQRSREIAIRSAMGATRWRVVRQLLIESTMLACGAGLVGVLLSAMAMRVFMKYSNEIDRPFWMDFSMDATVLSFLLVVCLGTALMFGLAPALHLSRGGASNVLKETAGRTSTAGVRTRHWSSMLVVVEVVLTVVLVAGAISAMRNLSDQLSVKSQIDTSRVLLMTLRLPPEKYATAEHRADVYRRIDERLARLANVRSVTMANVPPFVSGSRRQVSSDNHIPVDGERLPSVEVVIAGSRYFETVGLRILRGKPVTDDLAVAGREGVVVDQVFVNRLLGGIDPIGHDITLYANRESPRRVTIVGVAERRERARDVPVAEAIPVVYVPFLSEPIPTVVLVAALSDAVHATGVASTLREEVRGIDPDLPLFDVRTLEELLNWQLWALRVFGGMFAIFAGAALLIATVGIYGVVAYTTSQRTQEVGIRMTLGARNSQLWWTMMRAKVAQVSLGILVGSVAAFLLLRLMGGLLVGQYGRDPLTFAVSAGFLLFVAVLAMLWPVWRATSRSPVAALRYE